MTADGWGGHLREDILAAAEELIEERGVDALTVRAIAVRTNWGKSTVQSIIGSKEDLLEAVADRAGEDLMARVWDAVAVDDSPTVRTRVSAAWILERPNVAAMMFGRCKPTDLAIWARPWLETLPEHRAHEVRGLDEEAVGEALHLTHRLVASSIPLMVAEGDLEFARGQFARCFEPFLDTIRALHNRRTLQH